VMRPFKASIIEALAPMSAPPMSAETGVNAIGKSSDYLRLPNDLRTAS
jgi:hypothetical protein